MTVSVAAQKIFEHIPCVIIVDDEQDFAHGLARLVSGRFPNIEVHALQSGQAALEFLTAQQAHLLITDLRMPEMTGLELVSQALEISGNLSMVVLTAYGTIETAVEALQAGAYDFLTKPIEPEQLFRVVEKGLERNRLLEENTQLRKVVAQQAASGELVGDAATMRQLKRTIAAVAQSEYTVLIRGESGTGKELVARLIHNLGPRSSGPFVALNCPSIPDNLLESELFGYVKGAFTGADRDHKGLFAAAHKGSIHLDEIGDISPAIQTKLLRVLQDGEVRPVGSNRNVHINARVIASTNQDLEAGLENKTFREDLYYRLNVLSITIPPLRERSEDIPLLAGHFFRTACEEMKLPEKKVDQETLQWMARQPWPGNVRELQNFVRRLTVFAPSPQITMDLVNLVQQESLSTPSALLSSASENSIIPYKNAKAEVMHSFTRTYMHDLLTQAKGNVSEAARLSGLSRVALQKILGRAQIQATQFKDRE